MKIMLTVLGLLLFAGIFILFWIAGQRVPNNLVLQMDHAGIILGYLVTCLSITLGFIAWFRRKNIRQWLSRIRFRSVGAPFDVPEGKVVCAVIPVSPRPNQPEWILRWLKPQQVSFLYSSKSKGDAVLLA